MAYEKQIWIDGTTPLNAEHMNHIEDGIESGGANSYFASVQEGVSVTKEFLSDLAEKDIDEINIVGVTSVGPGDHLYSRSFRRETQSVGGVTRTTLTFIFLTDRMVNGEKMFGYLYMSATFDADDDPTAEYEWDVDFDPIVQASESEKVALTAPATVNDGLIVFGKTWQELHDGNYVAVVIETESGVNRLPIVSVSSQGNDYIVKFLIYGESVQTLTARTVEPDFNPVYGEK